MLYTRTRQHVPMMREGMNSLAWSMLPPPQRLSARDRLGREARRKRRLITLEEVRAHNDLTKDGWVIFENKVYSISRYAAYHPGGYYVLASVVGDDCTAQFKELHPWIQGHAMLKDYLVGEIESTPQVEAAKTLPVLTRGLSQWVHGRLAAWRVVSADKSAVLLSFEVEKGETRKTVAELNNSAELAKHVMFKLGPKFVRPYSNLLTAWPEKQLQPIEGLGECIVAFLQCWMRCRFKMVFLGCICLLWDFLCLILLRRSGENSPRYPAVSERTVD